MDQQQKVITFCEALGGEAVDQEFAQQVLEAHDWDLQAAISDILGDAPVMVPPAAAAVPIPAATAVAGMGPPGAVHAAVAVPVPGGAAPARWRAPPDDEELLRDDDGYRAPMRTGYTDQLIGPGNPEEERRRAQEAEAERRRREEQAARQAEQRRLAEERARHEELARQVERQKKEAEQLARERKEAAEQAEPAKLVPPAPTPAQPAGLGASSSAAAAPPGAGARQPHFAMDCGLDEDEDDDMDDWRGEREFLGGAFLGAGLDDDEEMDASAEAATAEEKQRQQEQAEREKAEERQKADAEAARQQQQSLQEQEALEREREEARQRELEMAGGAASSSASKADPVVQACVALRKRYKDSDPAGLTSCLETVRAYVSNLVHNPLEQKFQRINCGNAAFQRKVAAFEGAVEVLHACGFREDGDAALVVPADFVRSSGVKLRDALSKFDVMIEQLKSSA